MEIMSVIKEEMTTRWLTTMAVGRERTEEERLRWHLYGDKWARFNYEQRLCLRGWVIGTITTIQMKGNLICEIYEEIAETESSE